MKYSASGKMTALAMRTAFIGFSNTVTVMPDCKDIACLKGNQPAIFDYYVIPEILQWKERGTEWSAIPDQIVIKVSINDGQNLKELSSTIISGMTKWVTFGGDHPQDLLPEPVNKSSENSSTKSLTSNNAVESNIGIFAQGISSSNSRNDDLVLNDLSAFN